MQKGRERQRKSRNPIFRDLQTLSIRWFLEARDLKRRLPKRSNLRITERYGERREDKEQAEQAKAVVCMVIAERTEEDVKAASKMNVEEASKRDAETASKERCRNKHPKPKILESKPELRNLSPKI